MALKHFASAADSRLHQLEAGPSAGALAARLQAMAAAHARHAKGVEEVIRSLLADTGGLAKAGRAHESRTESLARATAEHHVALLRSCAVFSEALKVPSPLSALTVSASVAASLALASGTVGSPTRMYAPYSGQYAF